MKIFITISIGLFAVLSNHETKAGSPSVPPCGVFINYNPQTHPNLPLTDGISAGKYIDGSDLFIGAGSASSCYQTPNMPGRISIESFNNGPGVYMTCGSVNEKFDSVTSKYLQYSSRFLWVATTSQTADSVPNAVSLDSGNNFNLLIGRFTYTVGNGTSFTILSKVHHDLGTKHLWYFNPINTHESSRTIFEVLTCTP